MRKRREEIQKEYNERVDKQKIIVKYKKVEGKIKPVKNDDGNYFLILNNKTIINKDKKLCLIDYLTLKGYKVIE